MNIRKCVVVRHAGHIGRAGGQMSAWSEEDLEWWEWYADETGSGSGSASGSGGGSSTCGSASSSTTSGTSYTDYPYSPGFSGQRYYPCADPGSTFGGSAPSAPGGIPATTTSVVPCAGRYEPGLGWIPDPPPATGPSSASGSSGDPGPQGQAGQGGSTSSSGGTPTTRPIGTPIGQLVIYVQIPPKGSLAFDIGWEGGVTINEGHTWIQVERFDPPYKRSLGLMPWQGDRQFPSANDPSWWENVVFGPGVIQQGERAWDVRLVLPIFDSSQMERAIVLADNRSTKTAPPYAAFGYNCANFALDFAKEVGFNIRTTHIMVATPGELGKNIRDQGGEQNPTGNRPRNKPNTDPWPFNPNAPRGFGGFM